MQSFSCDYTAEYVEFTFKLSTFDFYYKKEPITACNRSFFLSKKMPFRWCFINYLNSYFTFSSKVCPYVFQDAILSTFNLRMLSTHFINRNVLVYHNVTSADLNAQISLVRAEHYNYDIDEWSLLNRPIFSASVKAVLLRGTVRSFQPDLFKDFSSLYAIKLDMYSIE
mgnify:CR=1 FL=1